MLYILYSDFDLDQLSTPNDYTHHSSYTTLFQSTQNGCESCKLIWDDQWKESGGDLLREHDQGSLDTPIIARTVNQDPGHYCQVRFGQEKRFDNHRLQLRTNYTAVAEDDPPPKLHPPPQFSFLWSFLRIAASSGIIQECKEDWVRESSNMRNIYKQSAELRTRM